MSAQASTLDVDGGVATITLAEPDRRNVLSPQMLAAVADHLRAAVADASARSIVLTNEGSTFCAGADLSTPGVSPGASGLAEVLELMLDAPKPVVGRIAGHCMGGGVGLAAACDIAIAPRSARFGFTEVRVGVAPAVVSVVCLAKLRRADALDLFLSGERISAERAAEVGLITATCDDDELDAAITAKLDALHRGGPQALAAAKALVRDVPTWTRAEAFERTTAISADLFASDEAKDGMQAFKDRRDPPWLPTSAER
jgi:enoyl-CoA hydratase/carnithine racemase